MGKSITLTLKITSVTVFNTVMKEGGGFYKNKKEHGVEKMF